MQTVYQWCEMLVVANVTCDNLPLPVVTFWLYLKYLLGLDPLEHGL